MTEPTTTGRDSFVAFLKAIGGYFTTVAKNVVVQGQEQDVETLPIWKPYQVEFERSLPGNCLVKFGFEELVSKVVEAGSFKNADIPGNIQSFVSESTIMTGGKTVAEKETTKDEKFALDATIVQAFVAYIAQEIMDIHRCYSWSDTDGGTAQIPIPELSQLKRICQDDEDLSKLVNQVGFSLDCGEQLLPYAKIDTISTSDQTEQLKRLEHACQSGTAKEVFDILTRELECEDCLKPLEENREANYTRLPRVPSLVCAPNFHPQPEQGDCYQDEKVVISSPRFVSPLLVACHAGNVAIVKLLLQRFGSNVNCFVGVEDDVEENESKDRYSPLYAALLSPANKDEEKKEEIVRLLVKHGARVDIQVPVRRQDMFGWTRTMHPLLNLAIQNHLSTPIVLLLLQYMKIDSHGYSNIMNPRNNSETPVVVAARAGRVEILQALLEPPHSLPVEPNSEPNTRYGEIDYYEEGHRVYTALMAAILSGSAETVELLIEKGADINRLYPSRMAVTEYLTPLRKAAQIGQPHIVRVLRSHSAPWSKYTSCYTWGCGGSGAGQVEIQDAIQGYKVPDDKRLETVRALIESGAEASTYMKRLANGEASHIPKEWKTMSKKIQEEMATVLLEESHKKIQKV